MMQVSNLQSSKKMLLRLIAVLIVSNILLFSCSEEKVKQEKQAPAPGRVTLKDGLIPINKTKDYTLFASVQGGKVVGWEVQDANEESIEITYKQETKGDFKAVKCMACIETGEESEEDATKCWEIPCDSMPNSGK
jgi:hypothetical protein